MQVGCVVFANRYTGAGAVAEHYCRALREVDIDAHFFFVAGENLEDRLAGVDWAHADLVKERNPARIASNLRVIRRLSVKYDLVICHLPHDHLLCVTTGIHRRVPLVRAFRNPGHLRSDPFHRALANRISGALPACSHIAELLPSGSRSRPFLVLPAPLEKRFRPLDGARWRQRLGIPTSVSTLGMVGKLARGRGFKLLFKTASESDTKAHVVVVGHGEAQPELQSLARRLGLIDRIHWAGYQDNDLPSFYATMDIVLFTASGSDWGHRTISEAQACGRAVVAASVPGVEDLIEDGKNGRIVPPSIEALAGAVRALIVDRDERARLAAGATQAVEERRFIPCGHSLAAFLKQIEAQR